MKVSTVLWIAGGAIFVGAVAYGVLKYLQKQKDATAKTMDASDDCTVDSEVIHSGTSWRQNVIVDFEQAQQNTIASIRSHHQEAAQQLKDTLNDMAQDSAKFEEKTSQINDDLDELLK